MEATGNVEDAEGDLGVTDEDFLRGRDVSWSNETRKETQRELRINVADEKKKGEIRGPNTSETLSENGG